jgi:hypothetical protein
MGKPVNHTLATFEFDTDLGPTYAARLLGIHYQTYAKYRRNNRDIPEYIARCIEIHYLLSSEALEAQIAKHAQKRNRK